MTCLMKISIWIPDGSIYIHQLQTGVDHIWKIQAMSEAVFSSTWVKLGWNPADLSG